MTHKFFRYLGIFLLTYIPLLAAAHGLSEADKQSMLDGGYVQYIGLGASHMLTGYDHLLFLFGVVFFLTTFKDVFKFVTVFTIGHCITLIFATFFQITWNYWLVDAIIEDRKAVFFKDSITSFLFVTAAVGILWVFLKGKLKENLAIGFIAILIVYSI